MPESHPQQLSDEEVAGEILKKALEDTPNFHLDQLVTVIQNTFKQDFKRDLTLSRATELARLSLTDLPKSDLLHLWSQAFDQLAPVYFSRTELINEIRRKGWGRVL